jgi:periplasmic copper chaperone A
MSKPMKPPRGRPCAPVSGPASALAAILFGVALLAPTLAPAAGTVSIDKPWMRFIIKARPAGGFFTLHNDTGAPIELTGAASSACGMVMLHETKQVNGVAMMLPVKSITVPAHGTLSFHPGGYHLMCMQPRDPIVIGKDVPVTLKFAGGKTLTAQFLVTGPGGPNSPQFAGKKSDSSK